jgi:putative ABC transport system permease protein
MNYVEIPLVRLAISAAFILVALLLSRRTRVGLEKDLAWGAIRAAVQLIAIGYALAFLFGHEEPGWVLLTVAIMLVVAAYTSAGRVEHGPGARTLFPLALIAIGCGGLVALVPMFAWIVPPTPWYEARYVVPVSGMMLSNAMNVVAQVFERLFASAHRESATIEQWLALGASPSQAMSSQIRSAVRAAMIPTINGLLTVGLVALPGMMTGQIVSGTSPEQAVRYQIVIMYQLVAVTAVSGILAAVFARRLLFTSREQLRTT